MSDSPEPRSEDHMNNYIGMDRNEAEDIARADGWTVRSLAPDAVITAEFVRTRLNFVVVGGVVTRAWKG